MLLLPWLACVELPSFDDDTADPGPPDWHLAFRSSCPDGSALVADVKVFEDASGERVLSGTSNTDGDFCGLVPLDPAQVYRIEWTLPGEERCFAGSWGISLDTDPDWFQAYGCPDKPQAVWTAETCTDPEQLDACWG